MAAKSDGSAVPLQNQTLSRCMPPPEPEPPPVRAPPPPLRRHYSAWDCCWVLCTLLVFFTDGATDLWLAADYYLRRHYWWFALTLLFVALPSAVVQVLSFRWFVYDFSEADAAGGAGGAAAAGFSTKESDPAAPRAPQRSRARSCCRGCVWIFQGFIHLLQLGEVWRYLHALYLGVQSRWRAGPKRRHYYLRALFESADISMLRLLESFLKSAPQLVLQLCFMVHSNTVLPLQALCASASLFSLAWMIASYHKVLRDSRDDKMPMSYKAVVMQMLWHLFAIGARAIAFALFASVFQLYFGIFVVAHWCFMTFWIIQGETDFCMSKWEEIVYNMMVGVVYIFCWFNVKEGRARCRLLCYCMVVLLENTALTTLWYLHRGPHTSDFCALLVLCLVACSQALGTFFMMVYYCLLHPDGQVLGLPWGCVEGGEVELTCPVPGMAGGVPVGPLVAPTDVVASPPRTLTRTTGADLADRDVFQVRPCGPSAAPEPLGPRSEGPVIRIDLPRKQYPAWDAHFIDRRLRKTILILERASPATPRLQYRSLGSPKEVMEYETTV